MRAPFLAGPPIAALAAVIGMYVAWVNTHQRPAPIAALHVEGDYNCPWGNEGCEGNGALYLTHDGLLLVSGCGGRLWLDRKPGQPLVDERLSVALRIDWGNLRFGERIFLHVADGLLHGDVVAAVDALRGTGRWAGIVGTCDLSGYEC